MLNRREKIGLILGFVGIGMFAGMLPVSSAISGLEDVFSQPR